MDNNISLSFLPKAFTCKNSPNINRPSLCPMQSNKAVIGKIALCALILIGVLFAAYTYCKKTFSVSKGTDSEEGQNAVRSNVVEQSIIQKYIFPNGTYSYSEEGKKAIKYANEYVEQHPTQEYIFPSRWTKPNKKIGYLKTHIYIAKHKLETILNNSKGTWNDEVITAADHYMKLSYAISCLMLEDLDSVAEKLMKAECPKEKATPLGALTHQNIYCCSVFFNCPIAYQELRDNIMDLEKKMHNMDLFPSQTVSTPSSHYAPFYEPEKTQNSWRELYNDYCDRVRLYVKKSDFFLDTPQYTGDSSFLHWIKKDTVPFFFTTIPDSLPPIAHYD